MTFREGRRSQALEGAAAKAVTAKNAQAAARSAEKTVQAGAAEGKKQRGIAETAVYGGAARALIRAAIDALE
ncbi:hypothetical protein AB0L54_36760 [Streptomyces sp. NPDC052196]|uniref:hypothetical protein n=1 Tax=Streptomyces sp. NPDC052196 TaxID=3156691 RepID=UPI0034179CF2